MRYPVGESIFPGPPSTTSSGTSLTWHGWPSRAVPGPVRFEADSGVHDHYWCLSCGLIANVPSRPPQRVTSATRHRPSETTTYVGECRDCQHREAIGASPSPIPRATERTPMNPTTSTPRRRPRWAPGSAQYSRPHPKPIRTTPRRTPGERPSTITPPPTPCQSQASSRRRSSPRQPPIPDPATSKNEETAPLLGDEIRTATEIGSLPHACAATGNSGPQSNMP